MIPFTKSCHEHLIEHFMEKLGQLDYAHGRVNKDRKYLGWVSPTSSPSRQFSLSLDLSKDSNQFLLFCLASAWSATGPWENAVVLIRALQELGSDFYSPKSLAGSVNVKDKVEKVSCKFAELAGTHQARKRLALRKDVTPAIFNIANNWNAIGRDLLDAHKSGDWIQFLCKLRKRKGLAPRENSLLIKIPLILRELRCQEVYKNIPGNLCCVVDERVVEAAQCLTASARTMKVPCDGLERLRRPGTTCDLIKMSELVYRCYGDLYDIPLFSYEDLHKQSESTATGE